MDQDLFTIPIRAIPPHIAIPCNLYIFVADKPTLLRVPGDNFTAERLVQLSRHGVRHFHAPRTQRQAYKDFLWTLMRDGKQTAEQQLICLRECAHLEMEDLETGDPEVAVSSATRLLKQGGALVVAHAQSISHLIPIALRDELSREHAVNVSVYAMALAGFLYGADPQMVWKAGLAGLLHDIGEQRIDPQIIQKGEKRSREEWTEWKKHTAYGLEFLEGVPNVPEEIRATIWQHHEHYDGKGHPKALAGEEIAPMARLISVCDTFDMLTTAHVDEDTLGPAEAIAIMKSMQPGRFDPKSFEIFAGKI